MIHEFRLVADLGEIEVPENYRHETCLENFRALHEKRFYLFPKGINDKNFAGVTNRLFPGQRIHAEIFEIPYGIGGHGLDFLRKREALKTGAQGLSVVFEQKSHLFPKKHNYTIYSPDEKECLPKGKLETFRESVLIPSIRTIPRKGMFKFFLVPSWAASSKEALLCCTQI